MIALIAQHNRMGFMLGIPGLCLQFVGNFMQASLVQAMGAPGAIVSGVISLGGTALLIAGLCYVAMAKGYHWGLGFLGLLSCLGLLILGVLPDKTKHMAPPGAQPPYGGPGGPQWGPGAYGPPQPPPTNPYAPPQGGWGPPPGQWGPGQGGPGQGGPGQGGPGQGGPGQGGPGQGGGGWGGPPPA